jgi:hypothetical protein
VTGTAGKCGTYSGKRSCANSLQVRMMKPSRLTIRSFLWRFSVWCWTRCSSLEE